MDLQESFLVKSASTFSEGTKDLKLELISKKLKTQTIVPVAELKGHSDYIRRIIIEKSIIISCAHEPSIIVWSLETHEQLFKLEGHSGFTLIEEFVHYMKNLVLWRKIFVSSLKNFFALIKNFSTLFENIINPKFIIYLYPKFWF